MGFVVHKIKKRSIVLPLVFLLIFFGLYVRDIQAYIEIQSVYFSLISAVLIVLLLVQKVPTTRLASVNIVILLTLSFIGCFVLSVIIGVFLYQEHSSLHINYLLQICAMGVVFFSAYLMVSSGTVTCKHIALICFFSGFLLTFYAVFDLLGVHSVRRIQLLGAKNYIAYSLSISIVSGMFLLGEYKPNLKTTKNLILYIGLVFLVVTLVLTGSRGAMLGLLISVGIVLFFYHGLRLKIIISSIFTLSGLFTLIILPFLIDMRAFFFRFSSEMLQRGIGSRSSKWEVFNDIDSFKALFFGKAHLYHDFGISDFQPHNFFLSVMMYGGILPSMFSLFAIMALIILLFYKSINGRKMAKALNYNRNDILYVLSIFIIMLVYLLLSGNVTKMVNVFFVWGCCLGVVARRPYKIVGFKA